MGNGESKWPVESWGIVQRGEMYHHNQDSQEEQRKDRKDGTSWASPSLAPPTFGQVVAPENVRIHFMNHLPHFQREVINWFNTNSLS